MQGKIIQVMGPVVDVEFDGYLPEINEAIDVVFTNGHTSRLVLEVAAHIGDNRARTIAMDMTEGLTRGQTVISTGDPIKVPVGEEVLGRILNVIGDPVDDGEAVAAKEYWPIHRAAPSFEEQSTKTEMFETGIKVVDLLAASHVGNSNETAGVNREEGGDDVKSSRPLRPGPHTCYNGNIVTGKQIGRAHV